MEASRNTTSDRKLPQVSKILGSSAVPYILIIIAMPRSYIGPPCSMLGGFALFIGLNKASQLQYDADR